MSISYPMPSWMQRDYDPAAKYLQGVQIGASIQEAQNKLQQSAQQSAMESQVKQEQAAKNAELEQQQHAITDQYQQQQIGLKQQQLQETQKKVALETQDAARTFQAQQEYQQYASGLIASDPDMDESEAYLRAAIRVGPKMGVNGQGMAAMAGKLNEIQQADEPDSYSKPTVEEVGYGKGQTAHMAYIPGGKSFQVLDDGSTSTGTTQGQAITMPGGETDPTHYQLGNRTITVPDAIAAAEKRRDKLQAVQDKDEVGSLDASDPTKKTPVAVAARAKYQARQSQIDALDKQIEAARAKKKSAPKAGDVVKGYRFKGGNPGQKENWEKVDEGSASDEE